MLLYVYGVVLAACLVMFRGLAPSICVIIPLVLVSVLTDAIMALLGIGLKTSTLPVAALGVGIGVDYGMYMFSRLNSHLGGGRNFAEAYLQTLRETGSSILLTGLTLAAGTCTWILSGLRFQADMGLLLTFVFIANMLGAVLLSPAIAGLIDRVRPFRRVEGVVGH
jgi:predicted RND superfamily exporter protein